MDRGAGPPTGEGFAVVAQEVKAPAAQTGKATGGISAQIARMQAATHDSVDGAADLLDGHDRLKLAVSKFLQTVRAA